MTCSGYSRMFGVIRKIFRKSPPSEVHPTSRFLSPVGEDGKNPFAFQGEPDPAICDEPPADPSDPADCLAISYNGILRQLPKELYGKNTPGAGQIFSVAKSRIIEQLTQGAIKVPFGEIRRAAPLGTFVSNGAHDGKLIDLPLSHRTPAPNTSAAASTMLPTTTSLPNRESMGLRRRIECCRSRAPGTPSPWDARRRVIPAACPA